MFEKVRTSSHVFWPVKSAGQVAGGAGGMFELFGCFSAIAQMHKYFKSVGQGWHPLANSNGCDF